MKAALLIAAVVATATTVDALRPLSHKLKDDYSFDQFVADFNKHYTADETPVRRALFEKSLAEIKAHNANKKATFKRGINHFADWTKAELEATRGNTINSAHSPSSPGSKKLKAPQNVYTKKGLALPKSVDYRAHYPNVLTAVKDQGHCGSCWAHAGVESIESAYALKTGELYVLSQQQLTSCMPNDNHCGGTGGCFGATANLAIDFAAANGITEEWSYSYQSYFGENPACDWNRTKHKIIIQPTGHVVTMPRNDANAVMESLFINGPLAISVDASDWHSYESGIYSGCDYSKNITMNHAVQLVGYGTDDALGLDYWVVRNSWSASWGEAGFIRLIREATPKCGWSNDWVTIGGGCKGEPNDVWSCGQCGILFDTLYAKFD